MKGGRLVKEANRKYRISNAREYNWTSTCSGMEVSDMKRVMEFLAENRRITQTWAELRLEHRLLKTVI